MQLEIIVEGHGEVESIPILVRRIRSEFPPHDWPQFSAKKNIVRIPKSKLLKEGEIEKAIEASAIRLGGHGKVIVLIDGDDSDRAVLQESLQLRASKAATHIEVVIIVIEREFESWIIHAIESLRGISGVIDDASCPTNPEAIRGAKEWLGNLLDNRRYSPILDGPGLISRLDMELCLNSNSFKKFLEEVQSSE